MADLEFDVADGVGTILLNRPERKNAFTLAMLEQWVRIIEDARTDDTIRVLVVTGAGGAFCSGVDLGVFDDETRTPLKDKTLLTDRVHRIAYALEDFDKPVIAAVDGVAVGAGLDFALMADLRLASASARFSEGYVRVGLVPGDGGCYLLPRLVGMSRALELLWTGDWVGAEEAERLGLVNHVYPDAEFTTRTREFAARLAAGPPLALRTIKRATYQSSRTDLRTALDLISSHQAVIQSTHDSAEALNAFREKRTPVFEGR